MEGEKKAKLLDLTPNEREWKIKIDPKRSNNYNKSVDEEEIKLELRLAPPGEIAWNSTNSTEEETPEQKPSLLSLSYSVNSSHNFSHGAKRDFTDAIKAKRQGYNARIGMELSLSTSVKTEEAKHNTARETSSKLHANSRNAPAPVVGWPPIRSFRKNIASSSKQSPEPQNHETEVKPVINHNKKGRFVKINMDGVPIGRKVNLTAFDGYEKLCNAIKLLFKDLRDAQNGNGEDEIFSHLLDGTGEYTLVYEDNEGDRVLASDVPWRMFVSMAKRLRVLKSAELSHLQLGANLRRKTTYC
ncbi:hypothetical protein LUZ60_008383 [Juncus effusus]|nr:hypothetical protein LUZ60_008383 [Juncus effusus]